jgi:hypothetical protein
MERGTVLLLGLLLLTAGAAAALVIDAQGQRRREASAEEFQRLLGGLGVGPALDLSGCAFGFDPRLDGSCSEECGPIPGGACFCPRHAGSILYYPPLSRGLPLDGEEDVHAGPP